MQPLHARARLPVARLAAAASVLRKMATAEDQPAAEPKPCAPCRGTGQVISNLGGEPSTVTCPWCEGSALQLPGHDAQAARRASAAGAAAA